MRFKKTDRPGSYPPERRAEWVAYAAKHSICAAARTFNVNHQTIRNHMRAAGVKPRRPGNYTNAELLGLANAAVSEPMDGAKK